MGQLIASTANEQLKKHILHYLNDNTCKYMYYLYCLVNKLFAGSLLGNRKWEASAFWMKWKHSHLLTSKSEQSHALKTYAIEILVLDIAWLNCGPEQWVSALTEWEFSPRKAHNHRGDQSVWSKRTWPPLSGWIKRERLCEKLLHLRLILRHPDRSLHTRWAHWVHSSRTSTACDTVICTVNKRQVFVIKFTPEGRHSGPPFCLQAFSILGILLWISKVCKCVHVKDSKSTRC